MPKLIDDALGAVGSIVSSLLTEAQFQALHGSGWILADARPLVSTDKYRVITGATNAPDLRGVVLRGRDHGTGRNPDGNTALGTYQADDNKSHSHIQGASVGTLTGRYGNATGLSSTGVLDVDAQTQISGTNAFITSSTGISEARMKNVTVNHFIRIN